MNNCFIPLCFFIAILASCTKSNVTTEITLNAGFEKPNPILLNQSADSSDRLAVLNPPFVDLFCQDIPAVIVPQIYVDESIELTFAKVERYTDESSIQPKAIKWQVNGETILQLNSTLKLPYEIGIYSISVIVTLVNDQQLVYNFELEVRDNMVLVIDGYIDPHFCNSCLTILDDFTCCSHQHQFSYVCPGLN